MLHLVPTSGETGFLRSVRKNQLEFQQHFHHGSFEFGSSDNDYANFNANANTANPND